MKHTKGKWEVRNSTQQDEDKTWSGRYAIRVGEKEIAQCNPYGHDEGAKDFWPTIDECEANAKLIAAAPELLEALINSNKVIEYTDTTKGYEHLIKSNKELINKTS